MMVTNDNKIRDGNQPTVGVRPNSGPNHITAKHFSDFLIHTWTILFIMLSMKFWKKKQQ